MAVEPERRRPARRWFGPGDRRRGDVLPDRVARAAVDEREALAFERSGRAASQARVSAEIVVRVHSIARRASTLKLSISSRRRAAASWLPRTPSRPDVPQPGDDLVRLRPVAHDVAQLPDLVHRRDGRQHCVEGRRGWRGYRRGPRPALGQGSGAAVRQRGSGAARRARAGSRTSIGPSRGTTTRRWSSRPGTRTRWISGLPARNARSAAAAASSSSSTGSRFHATRTPPGATSGRASSTSSRATSRRGP